jgi:hypothetical protein
LLRNVSVSVYRPFPPPTARASPIINTTLCLLGYRQQRVSKFRFLVIIHRIIATQEGDGNAVPAIKLACWLVTV